MFSCKFLVRFLVWRSFYGWASCTLFTLFTFSFSYLCTQVRCGIERWHYRFSIGSMFFISISFLVLPSLCSFLILFTLIVRSVFGKYHLLLLYLFLFLCFCCMSFYCCFVNIVRGGRGIPNSDWWLYGGSGRLL